MPRPLWIFLKRKDGYSKKVSYPFSSFRPYYEEIEYVWMPMKFDMPSENEPVTSPVIHRHFVFKEWIFEDTALYEEA